MSTNMHRNLKALIDETTEAFASAREFGHSDFAMFASLNLPRFQALLNNPDMTGRELRSFLRRAYQEHKSQSPETCWNSYLALQMVRSANANDQMHVVE